MEDSSAARKTWQLRHIVLKKRNVLRLHLNESKDYFFRRARGRSFHVEGPKMEMAREPTVESPVLSSVVRKTFT